MAREYNYIYRRLVEDQSDIIGHIAYSLYKADKVQYINQFKEENGREPKEGELKPFHDASCMDGSLNGYKDLAVTILKDFLDNTLTEAMQQAEAECQKDYKENLREVVAPMTPISKTRRYGEGIMQSVVGALVFALLVAAIAFIIQFKGAEFTINVTPGQQANQEIVVPAE